MLPFTPALLVVQLVTIALVTVAVSAALAHVFEFPGKMRLSRDAYVTVQSVYYPGFTVAGAVGEAGGLLATIVLLVLTPTGTKAFSLTVIALLGLLAMQIAYWTTVHPVNDFWLKNSDTKLNTLGTKFFHSGAHVLDSPEGWTQLRDRWEYGHMLRAGLVSVSFLALLFAVAIQPRP